MNIKVVYHLARNMHYDEFIKEIDLRITKQPKTAESKNEFELILKK